ncbi:MAG: GGDEF domain-containing protein [Candidatus Cohnella colombiensis]|uniref:GGDEF domain-containing protein n=1 Tax=Candidatus Cohnella colombiensis TaxID=3121368 RepID=A0AA95EZK3_9BACL|nr:MAG: GGDEF domain-containing protein [Cohnella sp.]
MQNKTKLPTVGFLSEHADYESEALMLHGANAAAEQHDVNFLSFSYESKVLSTEQHIDYIQFIIEQYELDGLLVIGWSNLYHEDFWLQFRERFHNFPIISIGKDSLHAPSVFVDGFPYVKMLTKHLIEDHNYHNIAVIEPSSSDHRTQAYIEAMNDARLSTENYIVSHDQLEYVDVELSSKMQRALEVLLDERKLTVDAIITMNETDGKGLLEALKKREIIVPDQIAIVSYEDSASIEYSCPSITTINYPFLELGRTACYNLIQLVHGQSIPHEEEVPSQIIYRDSCGCTFNNIRMRHINTIMTRDFESNVHMPLLSSTAVQQLQEYIDLPYEDLARVFMDALQTYQFESFLLQFQNEIRIVKQYSTYVDLQAMIDLFREHLLAQVRIHSTLEQHSELLWIATKYVAKSLKNEVAVSRSMQIVELNNIIDQIGNRLLSCYTLQKILEVLNNTMGWIQIQTNVLFLNQPGTHERESYRPIFCYVEHQNLLEQMPEEATLKEVFAQFKQTKNKRFSMMVHPLHINDEIIGIAWIEPGNNPSSTTVALCNSISTAIKSSMLLEESQTLVGKLSKEIELRKEKERQLAIFADTDSLTGLLNRRFFYDVLNQAVQDVDPFAIFFFDIDGFKKINDTLGHDIGDILLVQIAERINKTLHELSQPDYPMENLIFRLGGDEFTAIIYDSDEDNLASIAAIFNQVLHTPYHIKQHEVRISSSIGVSLYPIDSIDDQMLLKYADMAMYKAKSTKNTFMFFKALHSQ